MTSRPCPKCTKELPVDHKKFCNHCGCFLPPFCRVCREWLNSAAACPKCDDPSTSASSNAGASVGAGPDLTVALHTERSAYLANASADIIVMASIDCPAFESDAHTSRAPIDLCCVLDKSGSMAGSKIELVKAAVVFMIEQLKKTDRLSVIVFDTEVTVLFPLTAMSAEGKSTALDKVKAIRAGSQTNLSGAIFEALKMFRNRTQALDVSSILLFTDGEANVGIRDTAGITKGIENMLVGLSACSIFTFGFGTSHDAAMLKSISDAGSGMYYYIAQNDEIPQAFGDCLGGLVSVCAQNIKLTLDAVGRTQLKAVLSSYKQTAHTPNESVELRIGDMMSEEHKDLLFELSMPSTEEAVESFILAKVTISYFNVPTSQQRTLNTKFTVRRVVSEAEVSAANSAASTSAAMIGKQRNRLKTTSALETATQLARENKYAEARAAIETAIKFIRDSQTASDPFCVALLDDLQKTLEGLRDQQSYQTGTAQFMTNMWQSHANQRSTATCFSTATPSMALQSYSTTNRNNYRMMSSPPVALPASPPSQAQLPPPQIHTQPPSLVSLMQAQPSAGSSNAPPQTSANVFVVQPPCTNPAPPPSTQPQPQQHTDPAALFSFGPRLAAQGPPPPPPGSQFPPPPPPPPSSQPTP